MGSEGELSNYLLWGDPSRVILRTTRNTRLPYPEILSWRGKSVILKVFLGVVENGAVVLIMDSNMDGKERKKVHLDSSYDSLACCISQLVPQ